MASLFPRELLARDPRRKREKQIGKIKGVTHPPAFRVHSTELERVTAARPVLPETGLLWWFKPSHRKDEHGGNQPYSPLAARPERLALSFLSSFCFRSDPTRSVPSPHLFVGLHSYTALCIIHRRGQANSLDWILAERSEDVSGGRATHGGIRASEGPAGASAHRL